MYDVIWHHAKQYVYVVVFIIEESIFPFVCHIRESCLR